MPRYRVVITQVAQTQVREISRWWNTNSTNHPHLFREELIAAKYLLTRVPNSGPRYPSLQHRDVRRLLLPRTRHHVYYVVKQDQRIVTVLAIWHTSRESGPPL